MTLVVLSLFVVAAALELEARGGSLAPDQRRARGAIVRAFGDRSSDAIAVAWCESRLHPGAIGGRNVGVFQVNYDAHRLADETWPLFVRRMRDLSTNVHFAFRLSAGGRDWTAWTCRP